MRDSCRQVLRRTDDLILFDRTRSTWLGILGVTLRNTDTLRAALSVPDESGTGLAIDRPSPDDRDTLFGEVFHKVRLFHEVKGVSGLVDLRPVRDR